MAGKVMGARGIIDREQERGVCGDSEATWISWGWWGLGSQRAQVTDASDVAAGRLSYGARGPLLPQTAHAFVCLDAAEEKARTIGNLFGSCSVGRIARSSSGCHQTDAFWHGYTCQEAMVI